MSSKKIIAGLLLTGLFLSVYGFLDPEESSLFPKCPFLLLTGYQCPGCGSQRALHHLLHGEWCAAFHDNALLVCFLPLCALLILAEIYKKRYPRLYHYLHHPVCIILIAISMIWWWIWRNHP